MRKEKRAEVEQQEKLKHSSTFFRERECISRFAKWKRGEGFVNPGHKFMRVTKKDRNGSLTFFVRLCKCELSSRFIVLRYVPCLYASVNLPPSQAESVGFFNFLPSPLSLCCGKVGGGKGIKENNLFPLFYGGSLGGRECVEKKTKSAKVEGTFLFFSRGIRRNVFVKL